MARNEAFRKLHPPIIAALILTAFVLSMPFASAPPPGRCSPWPECKGGGGGDDGNILSFAPSNILTIDYTFKGRDQTYPIRLWQNVATDDYQMAWRSEDVSRYTDALIGDPDGNGDREIVALAWCDVQVGPKKDKVVERRVWLEAYQAGSTGLPNFQGPGFFVIDSGSSRSVLLADLDSTPGEELVVQTSHQLALFTYDPANGFFLIEGSVSPRVAPVFYSVDVGDVDGDGFQEVVVGTSDAAVYVWEWNETQTQWTYTVLEAPGLPYISKVRVGNVVGGDAGLEIVGLADDYDTRVSYVLIWRYDPVLKTYGLLNSWSDNLPGDAIIYALDLSDVDADGLDELVYGTTLDMTNGQVGVLDFNFTMSEWTTKWSTTNSAVTDYVAVGDADGKPGIELVFAGSRDGLYLEVFKWTGVIAIRSWSSVGEFGNGRAMTIG